MEEKPGPTWIEVLEAMIREIVREEISLHMERVVRYRGWGPAKDTTPRFLRSSEIKATAQKEE